MDDIDKIKDQWFRQRPDLDTDPMALIGRLKRVARSLTQEMDKTFAKHGLSSADFDVLATLLRSGPPHALTPNQLLESMMITSGTMTNRINQLEKAGYIERVASKEDKRSVTVTLTKAGNDKINNAVTEHVLTQKRLVSPFSEQERDQLNSLLRKYIAADT
ncbi:HTH-type transcriptional regulator MhqR [Pseudovibrio axinellae]|uniref:HTH-type transcriptional regulator MhqR n=1 Tax=Pseudovibrio axinellae TaxID=989403 RepID=A0A165XZT8_9HYPH|nr:MarR family transcriptional regulator [Pseudovibrio axinellae]KZL18277.1 HTH-type transcriptional regulator MhqR [Pseudovibrio axinellae]SER72857.1 DNA-binding transcriptional regulator, MarR family [Pseudovibrio axinellae]